MARIFIAGHKGMVGSALIRQLSQIGGDLIVKSSSELNLTDQSAVKQFYKTYKPDQVYIAAAKVGGIYANSTYPAEFIYENLMIQSNLIHGAHETGVQRLLFLGSSCIYPRDTYQPIAESQLLSGQLEKTNEPYAIAKIAGIKMCESYNRQYGRDYRSVMPTNLYGTGDNFHPENSHVIPALMQRFHQAKTNKASSVSVWGSGRPKREFLHVDDMASASIHIMNLEKDVLDNRLDPMQSHINIGTGVDCSIKELAETLADVTGYHGKIIFDTSKPDGTIRKCLNVGLLRSLGWNSKISLRDGLVETYAWFQENIERYRR